MTRTPNENPVFTPFRLGDLELPHRLVMAPLTRRRADDGKLANALIARHYAQRAGAALIVTESTEVEPANALKGPTRPGIATGEQAAAWRQVTDAVHDAGGRIFVQLSHMGRTAHPSQIEGGGLPVAPSAIAAEGTVYTAKGPEPHVVPRALDEAGIALAIDQFRQGARHARTAGFDGVEIHGANGYLIDQFLRDGSNRRSDRWGGPALNRARFLLEVIAAVGESWPAHRIGVRLSPGNNFQGMSDSDPAANFGAIAQALSPLGLAYLHIVEPLAPPPGAPVVAADLARRFGGTVIRAGGFDRDAAAKVIRAGEAQLVAVGTAFISNPDLPRRWREGLPEAPADKATFYSGGPRGYVDYPAFGEAVTA